MSAATKTKRCGKSFSTNVSHLRSAKSHVDRPSHILSQNKKQAKLTAACDDWSAERR